MGFSTTSISYIVVVIAFFLFSQISLHSAEEILPKCFPFHCETFEKIKHSFYIPTNTICGFSVIYCDYYNPVINPLRKGNYTIDNKFFQGDTPLIKDPVLKPIFYEKRKKSCKFLPSFKEVQPIFLYLTSKLRTLSKCNHTSHGEVSQNSNCDGDCRDCRDYELFFNTTSRQIQDIPDGCEVLRIPISEKLPPFNGTGFKKDFLASLLAAGFNYHLLHIHEKSEHKTDLRKKLLIGFTSAAGAVFFCLLCFFIYLKYKKRSDFSKLMYRNTSFDPSKSDLEKASTYLGIPIFSYSELQEATEHFNPSKELGDGGFGTVYHGKLRDGRSVAIKRLYENNYKRVAQFMNEVHILTHLHHQNLVTLYGCTSRHSRELLLVYEFISNGTLADHLHGIRAMPGSLTWPIRMKIAIETASALAYLHASDIIHRDVKTNNILLDNNYCVKVADFGLSRLFPADATHVSTAPQGTPGYLDPEYHQCYQLTDKSDVYSFGVVLVELISSKAAVDISRHRHEINLAIMAINKIQKRLLHELIDPYLVSEEDDTTKRMIEAMAELAFQCLQYEKEMRPSMNEVLEKLKGIENKNCKVENLVEVDFNELDEVDLLKSSSPPPASPSSVTDKGINRYGT